MKLPNGYGSVVKLSGNRRKPFMVRKTTGWNEKGHPIYKILGYVEDRQEGLLMLAEYNKNPYDVEKSKITLTEIYNKYLTTKKFEKMSHSSKHALHTAFRKTETLQSKVYREIKTYHMQELIDNSGGYSSQGSVKTFWKHMDKYAMELDVINKMYSDLLYTDSVDPKTKSPFTQKEINILWEHKENIWITHVLVLLYTGFRVSEYLDLRTKDVDLKKGTIKGGMKTNAGKNRIVPIHHLILPFIKKGIDENNEFLVTVDREQMPAYMFRNYFKDSLKGLGMVHIPHEARHTFRSRLDSKNANKVSIDLLMGHSSKDVGERVYTHKTIEELKETIELLD